MGHLDWVLAEGSCYPVISTSARGNGRFYYFLKPSLSARCGQGCELARVFNPDPRPPRVILKDLRKTLWPSATLEQVGTLLHHDQARPDKTCRNGKRAGRNLSELHL